ncbi:Kinase-like protein [Mycena sanguinolenta]|uniref:Kinase-like protein n=1 Tax=Mycena sanguinolenta TaxID=230812 RepID=A0A8H7DP43_9AGAR|nr:Kinase-like protein [Mycena sanguinolenta]
MSFLLPHKQGSRSRFLGLPFLRSTRSTSDISHGQSGCTAISLSTASPSTLSPSSPCTLSPSTSSPSSSSTSSSPTEFLGAADPDGPGCSANGGNYLPNPRFPAYIWDPTSPPDPASPPSYEIATSDGSTDQCSRHLILHTSSEQIIGSHISPNLFDVGTSPAIRPPADRIPPPPLLTSPLRSTVRVLPVPRTQRGDKTPPASLEPDRSIIPFNQTQSSSPMRHSRMAQPPAGARAPYATPRRARMALYEHAFLLLNAVASRRNHSRALKDLNNFYTATRDLTHVECLASASQHRKTLCQLSLTLGVSDDTALQAAFEKDQIMLAKTLLEMLYSPPCEQAILALQGDCAQSALDLIQYTLDHVVQTREATAKARRLLGKLCETCDQVPRSLIISGVVQRDKCVSVAGGFADVHRAMYQGQHVALKHMRMFLDTDQRDMRRRFYREALIWQRLRNLYIVPLIGIDTENFPPSLCLVSPWMKNGTINAYLRGREGDERRRIVNRLIREIAQGLAFLHDEGVVHGDLRGANILVSDSGNACLTDFGLTVLVDASTSPSRNDAGCARWMAPETLENNPRTPASDIYAFACVCLELYTGHPPFYGEFPLTPAVTYHVVAKRKRPNRPSGHVIPDLVWDLMEKCWAHDVADRPSILGILLRLPMNDLDQGMISQTSLAYPPNRADEESLALRVSNQMDEWTMSTVRPVHYQGWVAAALSPFKEWINISVNPRNYYLDLQEIAEGPGGRTTLYLARLADFLCDDPALPAHVKEQDRQARLAQRTTLVAIKSVPILPSGNTKLKEVLDELSIMHDLQCEHILSMDAIYVDPIEDALWVRMEFMTRSLSSIIDLRRLGLSLSDKIIAGCTKDVISALEYLRIHDITPKNVQARNVLINTHGVLKLTNLSNAVKSSSSSRADSPTSPCPTTASNVTSLCLLACDMATGQRPSLSAQAEFEEDPPSPTFHQFIQMYFDLDDWSPLSTITSLTSAGYGPLIESSFIRNACERPMLAQLLAQCTAFEARLREQNRLP